jgi:uncharacterized protein (DUF2235 family)
MGRNLVLCCDGTWNTPTQTDRGLNVPSNVVKMARAVDESDGKQKVYYDTGVGTSKGVDRWTGGAFGIGLTENIQEAYRWLATEYREGDHVYLFGFSRGAYTVRSLGGLIGRCGLSAPDTASVACAYELYRQSVDDDGRARAAAFKAEQRAPFIHFMGVWDTVGSLGIPMLSRYGLLRKVVRKVTRGSKYAHGFHDEALGGHVRHAYQALAIDEKRGAFLPSLWKSNGTVRPNVEQVWFAGAHCNVGGGYVDSGLSDHAFMWMASKAADAGLVLDQRYFAMRTDPNCHGELRNEYHGLYRVMPCGDRVLGLPDTLNEKIHKSAVQRMSHATNAYAPENLLHGIKAGLPITDDGCGDIERIRAALYPVAARPRKVKRRNVG